MRITQIEEAGDHENIDLSKASQLTTFRNSFCARPCGRATAVQRPSGGRPATGRSPDDPRKTPNHPRTSPERLPNDTERTLNDPKRSKW